MKITRQTKAGIMVLASIALLIFGYNFLKGNNLLSNDRLFYANYQDVEGLSTSSIITINGLKVGNVLGIDFADKSGLLKVTFVVDNDFQFGKNSVAKIYGSGFVGSKNIAIMPEANPTAFAESGQTLKSGIDVGIVDIVTDKLNPIQNKLNAVLNKTDLMLEAVNSIFSDENRTSITGSLKNLNGALNSLKYTSGSLQSLLANNEVNLTKTISNFSDASENAVSFTNKLADTPINKTLQDLDATIQQFSNIASRLESSEGTAGKLINDDDVYDNLDRASRQLDLLIQDIKLNPKRYVHFSVFGKNNKEYKQPKDSLK